jgi:hypothetical protein
VVALLLVSLVTRFAAPDRFPPGLAQHAVTHNELAIEFMEAAEARRAGIPAPYPDITEQFGLMSFLQGVMFLLLGVGFRQAMLLAALFGVLAVVASYLAGRELADHRLGLVSVVLLTAAPWHLAFSRYGDPEHSLPVFQFMLTLYLALVSIRRRSAPLALLLGLVAGLSWYVYATNQIVPVMLLLWLPLLIARFGSPGWRWPLALVAGFAASSWPAVARSLALGSIYPVRAALRVEGYEVLGLVEMLEQVPAAFRELFLRTTDPWFLRPGGMFPVVGTLLLVGGVALLVAAARRRADRPTAVLLLATLALAFLPAVASWATGVRRLLLVPAAAVFVQGWCVSWLLGRPALARMSRWWHGALATAAAVGWLGWGIGDYVRNVEQYESAIHRNDTEVALVVAERLGAEHLVVLAEDALDVDVKSEFIRFAAYDKLRRARTGGGPPAPMFSAVDATTYDSLASLCASLPVGASQQSTVLIPVPLVDLVAGGGGSRPLRRLVLEAIERAQQRRHPAWEAPCPPRAAGSGERP